MYLEITKCFSTQCATSKLIHLQNSPGLKTFPSNLDNECIIFFRRGLKDNLVYQAVVFSLLRYLCFQ